MARPKKYEIRTVEDLAHQRWCAMNSRVAKQERHKHATICDEWIDFVKFKEDMGTCPEGFSLERINNELGYNRDNCTWIPIRDQSNNRRCNHMINGLSLKRACELVGVPYKTAYHHVRTHGTKPLDAILKVACLSKQKHIREVLNA